MTRLPVRTWLDVTYTVASRYIEGLDEMLGIGKPTGGVTWQPLEDPAELLDMIEE